MGVLQEIRTYLPSQGIGLLTHPPTLDPRNSYFILILISTMFPLRVGQDRRSCHGNLIEVALPVLF